jgi:hypothetical protein
MKEACQPLSSGCGVGESCERVWFVGLDADYDTLVEEDFNPDAEADHQGHS